MIEILFVETDNGRKALMEHDATRIKFISLARAEEMIENGEAVAYAG